MAASDMYFRAEAIERSMGFAQARRSGSTLHVSGTVSVDETAKVKDPDDFGAQIRNVYDTLKETLAANGATFDQVVKETIYTTDLDALFGMAGERRAYYGELLPAATWVGVARLFGGAMLEVELTVELG